MNHATAPIGDIEKALEAVRPIEECPGVGECHIVSWCRRCGDDASNVCPGADNGMCDLHRRCDDCRRTARSCECEYDLQTGELIKPKVDR